MNKKLNNNSMEHVQQNNTSVLIQERRVSLKILKRLCDNQIPPLHRALISTIS